MMFHIDTDTDHWSAILQYVMTALEIELARMKKLINMDYRATFLFSYLSVDYLKLNLFTKIKRSKEK